MALFGAPATRDDGSLRARKSMRDKTRQPAAKVECPPCSPVGQYQQHVSGELGSAYVFNVLGTCCISNGTCEGEGDCQEEITPSECQVLGGRFFGPNSSCTEVCANGACIPMVSTWGVIVLLLLLATAGTVVLARGRIPARRDRSPSSIESLVTNPRSG